MAKEKNLKYIATYVRQDGTVMHRVQVILKGKKRHNLGSFLTEDEAIEARNAFLMEQCGSLERIKDYFKPTGSTLEEKVKTLLEKGYTVKGAAEKLGVSEVAIYRIKNSNKEENERTKRIFKKLLRTNEYFRAV